MSLRIRQRLPFYIVVIALLFASVMTSYAETINYIYDENNRLIHVIYEDGRGGGVIYSYDASGNRITLEIQAPDIVPPTGTITINSGDPGTGHQDVTLTLSCSDEFGCSQMQFSNDDVTYSTPEAYGTTKSWTLSPGDGTKTVYAKFKDVPGNWSTAYSDTIELRTTDSYTKSLLHMNGGDGSTTFTDMASGGTHTWAAHGNAQIDTAQSKFGGASGLFDGNGDYIDTPDSADWAMGSGNFTVDFWMRRGATGTLQFIDGQSNSGGQNISVSWHFRFNANNTVSFFAFYGSNYAVATSTRTITDTTTWHHIAGVRNGTGAGNLKLYIDGTNVGSANLGSNSLNDSSYKLAVGRIGEFAGAYFNGWIDEYRVSKGIARWTANFTPPTNEY
jgi:hypothetical protein